MDIGYPYGGATGALLAVRGADYSNNPGGFSLFARKSDASKELDGFTDGRLTWDGKNIVRSVNGTVAGTDGNVTIPMVANSKGYVTATWVSGTSGYRKWSDGYIEQWGQTSTGKTVSLHTAFSNSNYAVLGTRTTTNGSEVSLCFYSRTTTSFYANSVWVGSGYANTSCTWFASGY